MGLLQGFCFFLFSCLLELLREYVEIDPIKVKQKAKYPHVFVAHVDQSAVFNNPELADKIKHTLTRTNFQHSIIKLESIFEKNCIIKNGSLEYKASDVSSATILKSSLEAGGKISSKEDLLNFYTLEALYAEARKQGCNMILFGDNSTFIAIKVIANTSKGRGFQLPNDISLESISNDFNIVRPLRDILAKEIGIFNQYRKVDCFIHPNLTTKLAKKSSIDKLTSEFICGLENDFPSTVSTISRTAFKIKSQVPEKYLECALCQA